MKTTRKVRNESVGKAVGRGLKDAIALKKGELQPKFNALIQPPDESKACEASCSAHASESVQCRGKRALIC